MGYSWTDFPIDVGTDIVDDLHFQEAETNLNIELDRRGLPPISLGTLDIVDDQDVEILRRGIEDAEVPVGCPDHYYSYEETNMSFAEDPHRVTVNLDVFSTHRASDFYGNDGLEDAGARDFHHEPYDISVETGEDGVNEVFVYTDYQAEENGGNFYWDCGENRTTVDASNDVNIDSTANADVLDGYRSVHMQSWLTNVDLSVDSSQNFNLCSSHYNGYNSIDDASVDSNQDNFKYNDHCPLFFYAYCDNNQLNHFSNNDPSVLSIECPYHYPNANPTNCNQVDYPYCYSNTPGCLDECDVHYDLYEYGAAFGYHIDDWSAIKSSDDDARLYIFDTYDYHPYHVEFNTYRKLSRDHPNFAQHYFNDLVTLDGSV
jgi:hypothetical protein